ncbi:hypothetical protein GINT2_001750 [Glugoides intestinalis]
MNLPIWESDLPIEDIKRYSRQVILPMVGIAGQKALDNAKVLIVGLGGLGSPVLMYLATTGIRTIGIVDFDHVELHNLQRQVIHNEQTIGYSKTKSAKAFVSSLNSTVEVIVHNLHLDSSNVIDIIKEYDVVADCCDSIQLRYAINDACRVLGKDLVSASVLKWEGQICVIRNSSACYRCIFPEIKTSAPSCDVSGVMGPVCGVVGSMQAVEIVKLILNQDCTDIQISNLIIINCYTGIFKTINKKHDPCVVCKTKKMGETISKISKSKSTSNSLCLPWSQIVTHPNNYVVVDIRSKVHYDMFRVANSVNIPDIENNLETIKGLDKPIVVSCYRGVSSIQAADFLRSNGVEAYSSDGGIEGFKKYESEHS